MTCRQEILEIAHEIVNAKGNNEFTILEVLERMMARGSTCKESTIRTHVTSRMCKNAPQHHAVKYDDFERIDVGVYRLVHLSPRSNIASITCAMKIPSPTELIRGYHEFQRREKRDAMYKVASFLVAHFWGKPAEMADSLGVLLLTWNQAFYRYGSFDCDKLEKCIADNLSLLNQYHTRSILAYSSSDDKSIKHLFQEFLIALARSDGNKAGSRSPVATTKALHLLAADYFPLWDDKIARAYGCHYADKPAAKYLEFLKLCSQIVTTLQPAVNAQNMGKTLLKLLDEYNYAKYTKGWT